MQQQKPQLYAENNSTIDSLSWQQEILVQHDKKYLQPQE